MPFLIVPIGPSCAGKSTLFQELKAVNQNLEIFSWDLLRLKYYSPDYGIAWLMYQRDPTFFDRAHQEFRALLARRADTYVDNMNLTKGSRVQFTSLAKQFGYTRIAYYLDISFDELFNRHTHMRAKNKVRLSTYEIMKQLNTQETPEQGEYEEVIYMEWDATKKAYVPVVDTAQARKR